MHSARGAVRDEALDHDALHPNYGAALNSSPPVLISSKLAAPMPAGPTLDRPRLEALLEARANGKLTLLVAPAGFGKTTVTTQWLAGRMGNSVGWVSLEPGDDDATVFWSYVLTALATCGVTVPIIDMAGLGSHHRSGRDRHVVPLINALAALRDDVVLVLDDYHAITTTQIHDDIIFLIEQHLPHFHVVLLTRVDPPFPLARWKAQARVCELRVRDLAFTSAETHQFLVDRKLSLPDDVRDALHVRVGGWPAALELAVLWIAGRPDAAKAIEQFSSSDVTIADYLISEVLAQLPLKLHQFLMVTSILPRLNASLGTAVSGAPDAAAMLAALERRGFLVQALDPARRWLRYHELMAELLRDELHRTSPGSVPRLHQRASAWFAANDLPADAIEHAILAEDWAAVRLLLLAEAFSVGTRYAPAVVHGWLGSIPDDIRGGSPFFLLLEAFVLGNLGRVADARTTLDRSSAVAAALGEDLEIADLGALRQAIGAAIARLDCDLAAVHEFLVAMEQSLTDVHDPSPLGRVTRAVANNALAGTLYWHGQVARSAELLRDLEGETRTHSLARMHVNALSLTALHLADAGRLREAHDTATRAMASAVALGVSTQFQTNPAQLALAVISFQRGDRADAHLRVTRLVDLALGQGDHGPHAAGEILRARITALDGDVKAAFGILDRARSAWPGWIPTPALQAMIDMEEALLCLLTGDTNSARAVQAHLNQLPRDVLTISVAQDITDARLLLAQDHNSDSALRFAATMESALSRGQLATAVETGVGAAIATRAAGNLDRALGLLDHALDLAHDEDLRGPFLRQADAVRPLLLRMEAGGGYRRRDFREDLLHAIGVPPTRRARATPHLGAPALSARERTVLRLMAGALSNRDIAGSLEISTNTLKTHVRNVHRKLGAENRQQAVERARDVGLI